MAIITNKALRLSFTTTDNKAFTISIADPREDVTQAEVLAAMDTVLNAGIFLTSSGALTGIRDVKVIDTVTNDLYDPS